MLQGAGNRLSYLGCGTAVDQSVGLDERHGRQRAARDSREEIRGVHYVLRALRRVPHDRRRVGLDADPARPRQSRAAAVIVSAPAEGQ